MYIDVMRNMRHELYGESVFTSFRTFNGQICGAEQHFRRLYDAVLVTYNLKNLTYIQFFNHFLQNVEEQIGLKTKNHYCRMTIFCNELGTSLNQSRFGLSELDLDISIKELNLIDKKIRLKTYLSPFSKNYIPIKSGSYFQNTIFKRKAIDAGFDDALFVCDESITEASTSNIIFIKNGNFFYPEGAHFLQGITLNIFRAFCKRLSLSISGAKIFERSMKDYSGAFLLNSVQGLVPVESINSFNYNTEEIETIRIKFIQFCEENSCLEKN